MSEDTRHDIAKRPVVYTIAGADVRVTRDVVYRATADGQRTFDLHRPAAAPGDARLPAVIVVIGFSGARPNPLGCAFKDMRWSIDWGRLLAASGMVGIFYTNHEPVADLDALLDYVRANAAALGIDERRMGLFATSGNGPVALSALIRHGQALACGVLAYAFTLDLDGTTAVADAAEQWGFANAAAGRSIDDLPSALPLLVVRAGQDQFDGLNDAIDRCAARALTRNLPVTIVNHATGPHSFDLADDSDASRAVIETMLAFLRQTLHAPARY
jgi:hypothetical protein